MDKQSITPKEFMLELLAAVRVCFEGSTEQSGGAIVYTAPNGQKFRITAEFTE